MEPITPGLRLADDEQELLLTEVREALSLVRQPAQQEAYTALLQAVEAGEVPAAQLGTLQSLLEVGLESGRIRQVHTAHGEMAARRVYFRTPRGKALRGGTEEVSLALQALEGHPLREVRLAAVAPGIYSLSLATDQGRVLVRLDRGGAQCQSVEVG